EEYASMSIIQHEPKSEQVTELEAEHGRKDPEKKPSLNPILIAVWTAAIAAMGNGVVSWMNGYQMHRLESAKAQSAVILEVVKTNSPDKAASNLAFLVEIGVIAQEQTGERLGRYLKTRVAGQGPSISSSTDAAQNNSSSDQHCPASTGDYVVVDVH